MEQPNLSYITQMSNGDKSFEAKLIGIIKEELPKEIKTYFSAVESLNFKEAAQSVHKLKHKIIILGLEKSYKVAEIFEYNLVKENLEAKNDFETILDHMTNFLKKI